MKQIYSIVALAALSGCSAVFAQLGVRAGATASDESADGASHKSTYVAHLEPGWLSFKHDGPRDGLRLHFHNVLERGRTPGTPDHRGYFAPTVQLIGAGAPTEAITGVSGHDADEGFDATSLVPGPYRIEIRVQGAVVSALDFHVIKIHVPGNKTELAIDPEPQSYRLWLTRNRTLQIGIPVDAQRDRTLSVAWVKNGTLKFATTAIIESPALSWRGGGLYRIATWETSDISYWEEGHHEIAAVVDGKVVGSWTIDVKGEACESWSGLDDTYPSPDSWNCSISGHAHPDPNARKAIEQALAENRDPEHARGRVHYAEGVVCAVALDPEAAETLRQIDSAKQEMSRAGVASAEAFDTLADRYATHDARVDARTTIDAVHENSAQGWAVIEHLYASLGRRGRRYPKGCLAKLLPAVVAEP